MLFTGLSGVTSSTSLFVSSANPNKFTSSSGLLVTTGSVSICTFLGGLPLPLFTGSTVSTSSTILFLGGLPLPLFTGSTTLFSIFSVTSSLFALIILGIFSCSSLYNLLTLSELTVDGITTGFLSLDLFSCSSIRFILLALFGL